MNEVEKIVQDIRELSEKIRDGCIVKDIILLEDIAGMIPVIFHDSTSDNLAKTFRSLLANALEKKDNQSLSDLLEAIATTIIELNQLNQYKQLCGKMLADKSRNEYARKKYLEHRERYKEDKPRDWFGKDKRGVYVTAITGGYDKLYDPEVVEDDMDYICFSDGKHYESGIWKTVVVDNPLGLDKIRLARYCKIMTHHLIDNYDYCIWIDGKIKVIGDIKEYISRFSIGSPLLCVPHYDRDCIYKEAEICLAVGKGKPEEIVSQISQYRKEGYPEHNGLVDTGFMVKSLKDKKLNGVMEDWWNEIRKFSSRDQLSFNYVCYKHQFHYDLCNMFTYSNDYLEQVSSH